MTGKDPASLPAEDLIRLGMSAYLTGKDTESVEVLARAHHDLLARGEITHAVRCSFWIGFQLMGKGDVAQAGGWFARAGRLLEENQIDSAEQGYLLIPVAVGKLYGGDFPGALEDFLRAGEIAARFPEPDLITFAKLGQGQAYVGMGETALGMALLDEVMVGVTSDDVSAIVVGLVYCSVISACHEVFDIRRAHEWTEALTRWCAAQPDLVPYRGQCLVYRAQLMQLKGSWAEAMNEAKLAHDQLAGAPDQMAIGMAFYELAELHRLRGEFAQAEEAYRESTQWGNPPQPGLSRLRLAQGRLDAAEGAIRVALDEAQDVVNRTRLLPAFIEITLAAGDLASAKSASQELSEIAARFGAPLLNATADFANGSLLLAEGEGRAALTALRKACKTWQELEVPYEDARTRVLIALACRELGDIDTEIMELEAARRLFTRLGAAPDLARLERLAAVEPPAAGGLTGREVQVLALVATGKTNREIAADLVISEKTVARHLSNIFTKLDVSSRSAATAYAYEHHLV
ncbi:MAG: LuxR C-terminal-related transcriptional regulator [Actinobacteria bacterium]|nr:LuxR C-terminal-related transcriptional regulator [Actinomycetota bacterium]